MNKTNRRPLTKALALVMAFLLCFGAAPLATVMAFAEGATPQATPDPDKKELLIVTQPDKLDFIVGIENPSLKGLVVSLDGETYSYSDNGKENLYFSLSFSSQAVGANEYELYVENYIQGQGWIFGRTTLTFTGISLLGMITAEPIALTLNEWKDAPLSQTDGEYTLFSFTPAKDGEYEFDGYWSSEDDEWVDLYACLLDSQGNLLSKSGRDYGIWLNVQLQAGKTYYLVMDYIYFIDTAPKVSAEVLVHKTSLDALALNTPETVNPENAWFAFTPEDSGWYSFKSSGGAGVNPFVSIQRKYYNDEWGEWVEEPVAENDDAVIQLFNANSKNDGFPWLVGTIPKGTLEFGIAVYLYGGEPYQVYTSCYADGGYSFQMTVTKTQDYTAQLSLQNVNLNVRESKPSESLFKSVPQACDVLFLETWNGTSPLFPGVFPVVDYLQYNYDQITGMRRGTSTAAFSNIAGDELGTVEIRVDYSFWQWLQVIFLAGWLWLPIINSDFYPL